MTREHDPSDIHERMRAERLEEEGRMKERIEAAKTQHPDKEPFDIWVLGEHYDISDDHGKPQVSPEQLLQLEHTYYVHHPDVKLLKEFAEILTELETHRSS